MKIKVIFLLFSISACFCLSGCQKKGTIDDLTALRLRRMFINSPKHSDEAKQLAEQAILLWENDKLDSKPILIEAVISCSSKEKNRKYLGLSCYDEDKDLAGIIVEERSLGNDNDDVLVEKYLVDNNDFCPYVFDIIIIDIIPRAKGLLKKDELGGEITSSGLSETLLFPPVLVSFPSKEVYVYITLYDRQGNKSNKVKLIDVTKDK
jgi:hypothetical protein